MEVVMSPDAPTRAISLASSDAAKPATLICDWKDCSIPARFHIEVPERSSAKLTGDSGERRPFARTHHNVCGAHLDEYSATAQPTAIHTVGKCPQCDSQRAENGSR